MFENIKLRWFVLPFLLTALFLISIPPVISCAEPLEGNKEDAAHFNLGSALADLGRYQEAVTAFKEAIRINPYYAKAYYNLGVTYGNLHQWQEAITSYEEAIRIKPDYAEAYNNLGNAHERLAEHQKAITSYKEAIRIKPDYADAHYNLGVTYGELSRYQDAITEYIKALRINPDLTTAQNNLNELLSQSLPQEVQRMREALQRNIEETDRLAREKLLLEEKIKKLETLRTMAETLDVKAPVNSGDRTVSSAVPNKDPAPENLSVLQKKLEALEIPKVTVKELPEIEKPLQPLRDRLGELEKSPVAAKLEVLVFEDRERSPEPDPLSSYIGKIYKRIYSKWKTPLGAKANNTQVDITFTIFTGGNIDKPVIRKSAGDEDLDSVALKAIYDSAPFPPLPKERKQSYLKFNMIFRYVAVAN